jgi:hypothetical protein
LTRYGHEMIKIALAVFCILAVSSAAFANTNVALSPAHGGTNAGVAIFGYDSASTLSSLGTPYDHSGSTANLNDGATTGNGDDTWNQGNDGYVGAEFVLFPSEGVTSVVLYGRDFIDGGWFGLTGYSADGAPGFDGSTTLAPGALVPPTLQYTTDGGVTWISDAAVTNDYVAQMTGATANGGAPTNPATFTLTVPLTGIDGIRLIGPNGGAAGFLGADEIQVFAGTVPEPSTYAMMLGSLGLLWFVLRRKDVLS